MKILGATVARICCFVPEFGQIARLALLGHIVPPRWQVTSHADVISSQMRRLRGTDTELSLEIIVKAFRAGHAGQFVGVPYPWARAGHAEFVEVHVRSIAWTDAGGVVRIEDVSWRAGHAVLLNSVPVSRLIACHASALRVDVRRSQGANAGLCLFDHFIALRTSDAFLESCIVPRVGRTGLALKILIIPKVRSGAVHAFLLLREEVPLGRALAGHCSQVQDIGFRAAGLIDALQMLKPLAAGWKREQQCEDKQGLDEHLNMFYINLKYFLLINPQGGDHWLLFMMTLRIISAAPAERFSFCEICVNWSIGL